jgi:phosphopantothenoylcysteine decarboxylase/phosphopantothenate--cysteine ligase
MEMDAKNALNNAKDMLKNKNLDAVCLNILGDKIKFGSNETKISFITKDTIIQTDLASKELVASQITILAKNI